MSDRTRPALDLLRSLSGPDGIAASRADTANYAAVFARDGVIAGIAGWLADDPGVTEGFVRTLHGLRRLQGPEGQMASNYRTGDGQPHVSYGTLTPKLDAATWYLVGVGLGVRGGLIEANDFGPSVRAVVRLLDGIEYNGRHLLYVPAGGNWADEYPYDGYVLYDQVLRAWGLALCADGFGEPDWAMKSAHIAGAIRLHYGLEAEDSGRWHPLSAFSPTGVWDVFDLAACSLLAVSGLVPDLAARTLDGVTRQFLEADRPPPAFWPVIEPGDPRWDALRRYHLFGFRNHPHHYHNGGIWPVWLGWLAAAFALDGRSAEAAWIAAYLDAALGKPDVHFEEYLHGETGAPGGTPWMAYTASGVLLADLARRPGTLDRLRP